MPNRTRRRWRWLLQTVAAAIVVLFVAAGICYAHWEYGAHRLVAITPGTVYQSAAIPADEIVETMRQHGIRTVIDLRDKRPQLSSTEHAAVTAAGLQHIHLPLPQYLDQRHAAAFLDAMANAERPVLVHCHHGQGRSVMLCAIHRIENEGWSNEQAFAGCVRLPDCLRFLNDLCPPLRRFGREHRKGRFVLDYRPRNRERNS